MKHWSIVLMAILLSACGAKSLKHGAEHVLLSNSPPLENCRFVGEVHGGQGNRITDGFTSTRKLVEGSRNDLRNAAHKRGANFVHVQQVAHDTSSSGGGKMGIAGNAFRCPGQ